MLYCKPLKKRNLGKDIPVIIKKLRAASDAMNLYIELAPGGADATFDQRGALAEKLIQHAELLEQAVWWRGEA